MKATKKAKPARISIYTGKPKPGDFEPVYTVGDLKALLADMPDAMPLDGSGEGFKPVWFNVGHDDEHLSLEPNDGTWD